MPSARDPRNDKNPSTYFVQNKDHKEELARLTIQGQTLTKTMGGPLPEQADPNLFKQVLDIGCGAGDWVIDAATTYPHMSLTGIDISPLMIEYTSSQVAENHLGERVSSRVMDALKPLDFPDASFDLVNLRLGVSFIRTWDWPAVLGEFTRVTRPGGIVRLIDTAIVQKSDSVAVTQLFEMFMNALYQSGHLFVQESDGLTDHLAKLLARYGYRQVQMRDYQIVLRSGTPEGEAAYANLSHFQILVPFLKKWGAFPENFETIYHQALEDARQSTFVLTSHLRCAWGTRP